MTIGMNILITSLICGRLFYYSRRIRRLLGNDTAETYTSIAAILIESAAPYSLVGLMFLIPYAQGSGTAIAFGQVWAKMAVGFYYFLLFYYFIFIISFFKKIGRASCRERVSSPV